MQHNLREFLRHGGSGQYVFARQNGAVCGYRAGISIKSLFPGYADLRADFTDQLDRVIADNTRMLLNALTPPDTVPWVTEADLRDVPDAKEEALSQWDARLAVIFDEYQTHPQRLRPLRAAMEERLLRAFAGLINQLRQQDLDIERYIWRSQDDAKVRDSHAEYDDQVFRWDQPPAGGHPGQAHNCRCYAEPVVPGDCRMMLFLQNLRYRQTVFRVAAGLYAGWQMAFWPGHRRGWRPMLRWKPTTCFKASYSPPENSELETPLRPWVLTLAPWRACWPRNPTLRRWFWLRMASCQGLRNVANGRE